MSSKTYIFASDELSDESFNDIQNDVLEENFGEYVFIISESGNATFSTDEGSAMIIQEYV